MYAMALTDAREYIDLRTELLLERFLYTVNAQDKTMVTYAQVNIFLHMIPYTPGAGRKTEECVRRLLKAFDK